MQQRPHPERSSERFGEQHEIFEGTKISSTDQILQCSGDQILKGFAQDRAQQRLVVPEMIEQKEEVPKMVSQHGIQRRIVLLERTPEKICEKSGTGICSAQRSRLAWTLSKQTKLSFRSVSRRGRLNRAT